MPKQKQKSKGNAKPQAAPVAQVAAVTSTKKVKGTSPKVTAKAVETKKVKDQPARIGMSTKEAAAELSKRLATEITPVRLRRTLRTDDFANDGGYTRYDITSDILDRLETSLRAGPASQGGGGKGRPKKAKSEDVEAPEELDELEEDDEEEEEEVEEDDEAEEVEESDDDEEEDSSDDLEDLDEDDDEEE